MKACTTTSGRHQWGFVKNRRKSTFTIKASGATIGHFKLQGIYRCQHCTETKVGTARMEGGAL